MRLRDFQILSLLAHLTAALGVLLAPDHWSALFVPSLPKIATPIEIKTNWIKENPVVHESRSKKAPRNNGIGDPKSFGQTKPELSKLFGTQNSIGSLLTPSGQSVKSGYTLHDNPTSAWGSGGSDFERVQDFNLMHKIYSDVNAKLFYPSVLAAHKIEGVVNSRLVLNQNGDCDFTATQISSSEIHLRIYILSVLKKVCNQNYVRFTGERTLTNVDMSFLFRLTESNDKDFLNQQEFIVGNVLNFQRNSHQSMATWRVGPFTGLFPIPAVNIDFQWLSENWSKYIEGKDPMDEFRP